MLGLHQGALEKIRMEGMGHFRGFGEGFGGPNCPKTYQNHKYWLCGALGAPTSMVGAPWDLWGPLGGSWRL